MSGSVENAALVDAAALLICPACQGENFEQ